MERKILGSGWREVLALFLALAMFASLLLVQSASAQTVGMRYSKGRIFLSKGQMLEGKDLVIGATSVSMTIGGVPQTYELSEVQQIMAKRGTAGKWAKGCAGGCAGLCLLAYLATGGETEDEYGNKQETDFGMYLLSTALWSGISAGVGYLIGYVLDDWQVVYFAPRQSYHPTHFRLTAKPDCFGTPSLVLTYRF